MIFDIILLLFIGWLAYQSKKMHEKLKELQEICHCKHQANKNDPYREWRDPKTGLLKSRKNTIL